MVGASLKIGLIGLGAVGRIHLAAYRESSKVDVVAICDIADPLCSHAASDGGPRFYQSIDDMLEMEDLDLCSILTPPINHEEMIEKCLKKGVSILCEKPVTTSEKSLDRITELIKNSDCRFFYGASYRYLPAVCKAREIIQSGEIGDAYLLKEDAIGGSGFANATPLPASHYPQGAAGGGGMGLVDHGIHLVDIFAWLTDSEIDTVSGRGNISGNAMLPEYLTMRLSKGAIGILTYWDGTYATSLPGEGLFSEGRGWGTSGPIEAGEWDRSPASIDVYGTKGALRICYYANYLIQTSASGINRISLHGDPPPSQFRYQIECVADDLTAGTANVPSISEASAALRSILSIYDEDQSVEYLDD